MIAGSKTFYEWQLLGALAEYIRPSDYVIDVGANIGNHSLYFAAACGADVLSFEPLPLAADILQRNVERNFLDDQIEVRRIALAEASTRADLRNLDLTNVGATTFGLSPDGEFPVSALDIEGIDRTVAVIKVDAEGMDLAVLRGAVGIIARDRPIIVCEAASPTYQKQLEGFAAEISYTFVAQYNATPTYILAPAGTAQEQAAIARRSASLITRTNIATRDLYYRLGLVGGEVQSLREFHAPGAQPQECSPDGDSDLQSLKLRVTQLEEQLATLSAMLATNSTGPDE